MSKKTSYKYSALDICLYSISTICITLLILDTGQLLHNLFIGKLTFSTKITHWNGFELPHYTLAALVFNTLTIVILTIYNLKKVHETYQQEDIKGKFDFICVLISIILIVLLLLITLPSLITGNYEIRR